MSTTKPTKSLARASGAKRRRRRKRTELSEMVTRRAGETAALLAAVRVHKAEVGAGVRERFAPTLRDGEAMPDHELSLELAGRSVELAFERLDELDNRHRMAKGRRAEIAGEADRIAKEELYPVAVAARRRIDEAFGRRSGAELHTFTGVQNGCSTGCARLFGVQNDRDTARGRDGLRGNASFCQSLATPTPPGAGGRARCRARYRAAAW